MQTVVGFHYTLRDKEGDVLDSSEGGEALWVMLGRGHIVKGLDEVLPTMAVGDKKSVIVKPEDGYGPGHDQLRMTVNRSQFPDGAHLFVGNQFQVDNAPGNPVFRIVKIDGDDIHIDGNHPLAGETLFFHIELVGQREATQGERDHGHAHGPDGHAHHH